MILGDGIMARRQRARLQQISADLRPAAARRVLIKDDGGWWERVGDDVISRTDADAAAAEAAGARLIVIEYVDGEDWRGRWGD